VPDEIEAEMWALLKNAAHQVDPVPEEVTDLARAALGFVSDISRAELVFDSWTEETNAVRSTEPDRRVLEFTGGDHTVEIEVDQTRRPVASGQIEPPGRYEVVVETPAGPAGRVQTGASGEFVFDEVPPGPTRLVVVDGSTRRVATAWLVLVTTP
jgi:hypothetical protein